MNELATVQGIARGRVQGVWYRAHTRDAATRAGLSGYARNEADGTVSFVLSGRRDSIESVLEALRSGPRLAKVTGLEVEWQTYRPMDGFQTG
jgi:acylphosphatase